MENRSVGSRRPGFTLVEILTVVVIIGILMGLVTATVGPVRRMVKNWRMKSEILQLTLALEQVKTTIGGGEYPPDGASVADVQRFLRRAFPRATYTYAAATVGGRTMIQVQVGNNKYTLGLLPETAICFWLGGIRDASGNFVGLSADPTDPFNLNAKHAYSPNTPESRIGPFYDFDKTRIYQVLPKDGDEVEKLSYDNNLLTLKDSNDQNCQFYLGYTAYFPQNDQVLKTPTSDEKAPDMDFAPYLYFKPVSAMYSDMAAARKSPPDNTTEAYHWWRQPSDKVYITPLKDAKSATSLAATANCVTRAWINPTSFQILCPGLDGLYGASTSGAYSGGTESEDANSRWAPIYPDGANYSEGTKDDVTNFSNGKLEADMP